VRRAIEAQRPLNSNQKGLKDLKTNKMREKLYSVISTLFYILLSGLFIIGIIHSAKKHGTGDVALSVVAFPFGIYRGVESFWHKNPDIDWDKRIQSDIRVCYQLLYLSNSDKSKTIDFADEIEKMSNRIKEYPDSKRQLITNGSIKICQFIESTSRDLFQSMTEQEVPDSIKWSNNTNKIASELGEYHLTDDIAQYEQMTNALFKKIIKDNGNKAFDNDLAKIEALLKDQKIFLNKTFKSLFNEEL